jgi:hypothetical protein
MRLLRKHTRGTKLKAESGRQKARHGTPLSALSFTLSTGYLNVKLKNRKDARKQNTEH